MQTLEEKKAHIERRRDAYLKDFAVTPLPSVINQPLVDLFTPVRTSEGDVCFSVTVTSASREGSGLLLLQRQVARCFLMCFRRTVNWYVTTGNDLIKLRIEDNLDYSAYSLTDDPEALIILGNSVGFGMKPAELWLTDIIESRSVQKKPTLFVSMIHTEVYLPNRYVFSEESGLRKLGFTIPIGKPIEADRSAPAAGPGQKPSKRPLISNL